MRPKPGGAVGAVEAVDTRPALRALRHSRPFLALVTSDVQSVVGDQIARVALSVLVFERTGSAAATALTYAATFAPAVVGGLLFSGAGDRFSRGPVMVAVALVRAALFATMAVSGLALPWVVGLLVLAVLIGPVFGATEVAYLASVLDEEAFAAGTGIRLTANQISQVLGFVVGGVVVAALGPGPALLVNAGTFVLAAVLVFVATRGRAGVVRAQPPSTSLGVRNALRWFVHNPLMLALVAFGALDGFFVVPEGLAVPFADDVGAGTVGAGLLLAALPLGSALGAFVLVRYVPYPARPSAARWMAAASGVPLLVSAAQLPWPVIFAAWAVTGGLTAFQVVAITTVANAAPGDLRARVIGVGGAAVTAAQGIGIAAFGTVARATDPGFSIAAAGLLGSALACLLVLAPLSRWRVTAREPDRH